MRYKLLGRSGLRVAELALGGMTLGKDWGWGADDSESRKIFDAYAEAGGNLLDTANGYTGGTSEKLIGQFVSSEREQFVLSTKYTLSSKGDDPNASGNHRKNLVQSLEGSLRRLQTDYIDLYWVHIWDPFTPIEETMRALDDQVRLGKILYLGVSDMPAWLIARANTLAEERGWTHFSAMQAKYSLVERSVERELLPMSKNLELAFTAWGALGTGVLTGKYNRDPSGDGGRIVSAGWGQVSERDLTIAREVESVAEEVGASCSQVALAWLQTRSATMIPIIGARTLAQMQDNLACTDVSLSQDQLDRLDKVSAIELGFPHDFIRGGRVMFMGEVTHQIDDHRDTAAY